MARRSRAGRGARLLPLFFFLAAATLATAQFPGLARAEDPTIVTGKVGAISGDAVWVAGRSGLLGPGSDIRSEGHPASRASIRVGMTVQMEVDAAGRILEIRLPAAPE